MTRQSPLSTPQTDPEARGLARAFLRLATALAEEDGEASSEADGDPCAGVEQVASKAPAVIGPPAPGHDDPRPGQP